MIDKFSNIIMAMMLFVNELTFISDLLKTLYKIIMT